MLCLAYSIAYVLFVTDGDETTTVSYKHLVMSPIMGLETKTHYLTDRQSQSDFDSYSVDERFGLAVDWDQLSGFHLKTNILCFM
jgi:hypothetical protein